MQFLLRHSGLTFLLLISSTWVRAQNLSKIDSLHTLLPHSSGIERYHILNDIGFEYRLSFPDSTIYYCNEGYRLGLELDLSKDLSRPLSFIGLANAYKGDYKTSFEFHTKAIEVAQRQADSVQLGYSYNNFGRLFFDQGDMTRAYDNLLKSQEIFERIEDETGMAYVYRSISNLHKSQRDFPKALQMSRKAYELRLKSGDPRALLSALMEMGSVYSDMNSRERANRCFEQADSIATKIDDHISLAETRIGWAEYLIIHGDSARAHKLAHLAYSMISEAGNQRLLPRASLLMGLVHFKLGALEDAKGFLNQVIHSTEESHRDLQRDAYYYFSKIYEIEGRQADATLAFNKHLILKESLQSVELARQIEKLQFQLEIERIERENEILKTNDARSDAIIRQQQLENIILIAIVTFVSVLFIMQWRNTVKRSDANNKLAKQNQEIEKQKREIAEQNEKLEKRNQELSELNHEKDTLMNIVAHDLKSPLNRIKGLSDLMEMEDKLTENQSMYLKLLKDSTRAGLDLIVDLLDVNALEVNREPNYSFFDLTTFLNDRVNMFRHHASAKGISLNVSSSFKDLVFLDHDYMTRILDNLISNAIKFSSRDSTVHVSAETKGGSCSIQVKDEGPGFTPEDRKFLFQKFKKLSARPTGGESSNGLGLAIVKILAERLGGKIELHTQPGKGSMFEILFPIKDNIRI